jgi:hypothetical protein
MAQEIDVGMGLEIVDLPFEPLRIRNVVGIHPRHILTPCLLHTLVQPDSQAPPLRFIDHPNSGIVKLTADLRTRIGGGIVHEKEFPIREGLPEKGMDG